MFLWHGIFMTIVQDWSALDALSWHLVELIKQTDVQYVLCVICHTQLK